MQKHDDKGHFTWGIDLVAQELEYSFASPLQECRLGCFTRGQRRYDLLMRLCQLEFLIAVNSTGFHDTTVLASTATRATWTTRCGARATTATSCLFGLERSGGGIVQRREQKRRMSGAVRQRSREVMRGCGGLRARLWSRIARSVDRKR